MLALAVIWWAWVCYSWLTSVIEPEEGSVRIIIFGAMAGSWSGSAFPRRSVTVPPPSPSPTASCWLGHIALFVMASRGRDLLLRRSVLSLCAITAVAVGVLVGASFVDGGIQAALCVTSSCRRHAGGHGQLPLGQVAATFVACQDLGHGIGLEVGPITFVRTVVGEDDAYQSRAVIGQGVNG